MFFQLRSPKLKLAKPKRIVLEFCLVDAKIIPPVLHQCIFFDQIVMEAYDCIELKALYIGNKFAHPS